MATAEIPVFQVQVRELVEFALRCGDLGGERDFVGPRRALEGIRGHLRVQRSRPSGYQKEVRLCHEVNAGEFILRVQGRIDGLLVTPPEVVLEEIKTVRADWDGQPDLLHWAQARIYGFIYTRKESIHRLLLQLTYLNLDTGKLTEFQNLAAFAELQAFFDQTTASYQEWLREWYHWQKLRDASIRSLAFPFASYRPGQRKLAVAVYRALTSGQRLFLEAPTGIGKTVSALFPAVKALAEGGIARLFYLTARTVGRVAAEKACAELRGAGLHLRSLTLTAKEKLCARPGQPCDAQTCPLAQGFYDRLRPAMRAALKLEELTRSNLETVSQAHQVCPFELSLALSVWVDVVICDYNYVFDPRVYLRRHFAEDGGDYAFLVDEAHNLVDRAREMFSAALSLREILEVKRATAKSAPQCAKALGRLSSAMRKLGDASAERQLQPSPTDPSSPETDMLTERRFQPAYELSSAGELDLFSAGPSPDHEGAYPLGSAGIQLKKMRDGICVMDKMPQDLVPLLEAALEKTEHWLSRNEPAEFRDSLLDLYFRLHSFVRTAAIYDQRFVTLIEPAEKLRVRLFCLDPSELLRQALARGKAAVFFSATLTPLDYFRDLLGGRLEDPVLRLPSPFSPENLAVLVHGGIRTHLKARESTLGDVAEAVGAMVTARRGNYLVYLPSYQYLDDTRDRFSSLFPEVAIQVQRPAMNEIEREAFLAAFRDDHEETLVGFAVMGGIFGEAIDLVGDRLVGAVIVGVGLPQLCAERDLIRDYFQQRTGAGFEYAYTFPGMNRVLQAVGRVIRSETDRGVVLLLDTRFTEARYRCLFPPWWKTTRVASVPAIGLAVSNFWKAAG